MDMTGVHSGELHPDPLDQARAGWLHPSSISSALVAQQNIMFKITDAQDPILDQSDEKLGHWVQTLFPLSFFLFLFFFFSSYFVCRVLRAIIMCVQG